MSLGYHLGGRLADKNPSYGTFSGLIALSAVLTSLFGVLKNPVLLWVSRLGIGISFGSILSAIILLALPAIALAAVSPYAIKLSLTDIKTAGATAGRLYALSTLGSIFGTFMAPFVLIPTFGSTKNVVIISVILLAASLLFAGKKNWRVLLCAAVIVAVCSGMALTTPNKISELLAQKETRYSTISVIGRENVRIMLINNENSSAVYTDGAGLVFDYLGFYDLAFHFKPEAKSVLCIGGAGYAYPTYYISKYPDCTMDVVEIDAGVTAMAREYFGLVSSPRLKIIHQDGRVFLNENTKKYDAVLGDAFHSYSPPAQLVTVEATRLAYDSLNDGGSYIINMIGSLGGRAGSIVHAMYSTMSEVFPQVYVFPVTAPDDETALQNIIIAGIKSADTPSFESMDDRVNGLLSHMRDFKPLLPAMTDEFCPVDFYTSAYINKL
jgi:spermidine synthase